MQSKVAGIKCPEPGNDQSIIDQWGAEVPPRSSRFFEDRLFRLVLVDLFRFQSTRVFEMSDSHP